MPAAADGSSFLNILSIIELYIYRQDSVLPRSRGNRIWAARIGRIPEPIKAHDQEANRTWGLGPSKGGASARLVFGPQSMHGLRARDQRVIWVLLYFFSSSSLERRKKEEFFSFKERPPVICESKKEKKERPPVMSCCVPYYSSWPWPNKTNSGHQRTFAPGHLPMPYY